MTEQKKQTLVGKKIVIVGEEHYTNIYKEDMERHGAVVEYPASNIGDKELKHDAAETIGKEILAMERKPDVVFIHHPQMDMYEAGGQLFDRPFEDNPTLELAGMLKTAGIPTLIVDQYGRRMTQAKEAVLRDAGATFRGMFDTHYDEVTTLLAYMANNKGKLTGFGAARRVR